MAKNLGEIYWTMDSPKTPITDPSILLLNEIEILLAQSRLLELYLKQSQATAAYETAQVRDQHQRELGELRTALAEKERIVAVKESVVGARARDLQERVQSLESDLSEFQSRLQQRDAECQRVESEAADLRKLIDRLELAKAQAQISAQESVTASQELATQLTNLREQLEENQINFQKHEVASRALQNDLQNQIAQLHDQLNEKPNWSRDAETELQQAKRELAELHERIADLQTSHEAARARAARELAESRARFESQLNHLQTVLAERDGALEENQSAMIELERGLRTEILTLRSQLEQKQELIEFRDAALSDDQSRIAALLQRIADLEATEEAVRVKADHIEGARRSYEDQIAALQHEVAARDRALMERQEAVSAVELALHGRIQSLQQELFHNHSIIEERENALRISRAETDALRTQVGQQESAVVANLLACQRAEETCSELQAEISRLHASLAQKEYALNEQHGALTSLEQQMRAEIDQLHRQLDQQQALADTSNAELGRLRSEMAGIEEEKTRLAVSQAELERIRQQEAAARGDLEARLFAKDNELRAVQATGQELVQIALREQEAQFKSLAEQTGSEIIELRKQLQEQELATQQRDAELVQLRTDIAGLREQIARTEQSRDALQRDLQQTADQRDELAARCQTQDDELQAAHSGVSAIRSEFDARINELQLQLAQKQLLVESQFTEIENLKTQIGRLSEQLAQRDSARGDLQAHFQEEIESARAEHQAALDALRHEYQLKQRSLGDELFLEKQRVGALMHQTAELEQRKSAIETQIQERQREHDDLTAEAAGLRSRLDELETRRQTELAAAEQAQNQVRSDLEAELAAARSELQHKAWASAQHHATLENLALTYKEQIQKLEEKITEQENSIKTDHLELERSHAQARLLDARVEELNAELRQAELTTVNRAVHIKEEYGIRIAELERQIAQKTIELQERGASGSDMEQSLRSEIDRLIREGQERHQILQDRNDELVRVKAEMDALQEQFHNMESAASQTEASLSAEAEKMRTEFQAQLALLQAELSQKEWALEEQRAATGTIEAQFRQNLQTLNQQLAETEARAKDGPDKFVLGENTRTSEQQERYKTFRDTLDAVVNGDDGSFPASENRRRWRSGFGWKRRWKS